MFVEENVMAPTTAEISVREIGHELVDELPEGATLKDLSDLAYKQYLRALVDEGTADIKAGRVVSHEAVKARYPLP